MSVGRKQPQSPVTALASNVESRSLFAGRDDEWCNGREKRREKGNYSPGSNGCAPRHVYRRAESGERRVGQQAAENGKRICNAGWPIAGGRVESCCCSSCEEMWRRAVPRGAAGSGRKEERAVQAGRGQEILGDPAGFYFSLCRRGPGSGRHECRVQNCRIADGGREGNLEGPGKEGQSVSAPENIRSWQFVWCTE